jgi:hypothetical protein
MNNIQIAGLNCILGINLSLMLECAKFDSPKLIRAIEPRGNNIYIQKHGKIYNIFRHSNFRDGAGNLLASLGLIAENYYPFNKPLAFIHDGYIIFREQQTPLEVSEEFLETINLAEKDGRAIKRLRFYLDSPSIGYPERFREKYRLNGGFRVI